MASADGEPKQRGRRRSAKSSSRAPATKTTKKNSGEASQSAKRRADSKPARRRSKDSRGNKPEMAPSTHPMITRSRAKAAEARSGTGKKKPAAVDNSSDLESSQTSKRRNRAKKDSRGRGTGTLAEYLGGRSNVRLNSEQCRAVNDFPRSHLPLSCISPVVYMYETSSGNYMNTEIV
uniref:Uncharacterized protein n=1 Tax=Globodera rostochiensis TaxID=31243 RepID=A0A914HXB3_GLORO